MSLSDLFKTEHIIRLSGVTLSLRENYFYLVLLPWRGGSQLMAWFPSGDNNNKEQATYDIQHGRNCGSPPPPTVTEKTLHSINTPPPPISESFVGNSHFTSEEQRASRARAETGPGMNAEAASQVISLGCAWL